MTKTSILSATLTAVALCNLTDANAYDKGATTFDDKGGDTIEDKGDTTGKEMVWDESLIKGLYNLELAKEYADPNFPVIDKIDPGPRCLEKEIAAKKTFNMPLYTQSVGGVPFNAGVAGELALEASATKLGVTGSLGPSIDVFGEVRTPLDLTLSATTTAAGTSAVEYAVTAFGYTLTSDTLASTSNPIQVVETFGWSLPNVFTGQVGDTLWIGNIGSRVRNAEASWSASATAQAHVGGLLMFDASTAGVKARALVSADAYAALQATATLTAEVDPPDFQSDWHGITLEHDVSGHLDLIRLAFGGRGQLVPHGAYWVAEAGASVSLTDTMGAHLGTTFSIEIPWVDDPSYHLSFFDLLATSWNDTWSYSCAFNKQFK